MSGRNDWADARELLFVAWGCRAVTLDAAEDEARLQAFFEANPAYFIAVHGEPAQPGEARDCFASAPPPGYTFTHNGVIGFVDADDALVGMAEVTQDLFATGVWHVGLFIVATRLHGGGTAQALYGALERWARAGGADWMRLGVVDGNVRAEKFWRNCGFVELRRRHGVEVGRKRATVRVMAKPLAGGAIDDYLARVARDRPDAE